MLAAAAVIAACNGTETKPSDGGAEPTWHVVHEELEGALLSVWGTSQNDVWTVGADARDGSGPLVLHYDGSSWARIETGQTEGDLWSVYGFEGGAIYMGGNGGVILRYEAGSFDVLDTPTTDTVFGIWGASPSDMWAVGGTFDTSGFAWRLAGDQWEAEASLPAELVSDAAIWKVFGRSAEDVWLVGSDGLSFHWQGSALEQAETGVGSSLFTVHANSERFVAVGGLASGVVVENDGSGWSNARGGSASYGLTGVALDQEDGGWAVGQYGLVAERTPAGWAEVETGLDIQRDFHSVWLDPSGGVWAVGGVIASFPLVEGLLVHRGVAAPAGQL